MEVSLLLRLAELLEDVYHETRGPQADPRTAKELRALCEACEAEKADLLELCDALSAERAKRMQLAAHADGAIEEQDRLELELLAARKALYLVLPLAKGYAAAHPVGSNAAYIKEAESALRPLGAKDEQGG